MAMTVEQAQHHNASRMTDKQLLRELRVVSNFTEQPDIRVKWIAVLKAEIEKRGVADG